jgi:hypothetical protein
MRLITLALLALAACGAEAVPMRDVSDFCAVPASACGKALVDEQGHSHTVVCLHAGR